MEVVQWIVAIWLIAAVLAGTFYSLTRMWEERNGPSEDCGHSVHCVHWMQSNQDGSNITTYHHCCRCGRVIVTCTVYDQDAITNYRLGEHGPYLKHIRGGDLYRMPRLPTRSGSGPPVP